MAWRTPASSAAMARVSSPSPLNIMIAVASATQNMTFLLETRALQRTRFNLSNSLSVSRLRASSINAE